MKKISTTFLVFFTGMAFVWAQSPTASRNHMVETVVKVAGRKTTGSVDSLVSVDSANRTIQYLDGLGRPLQTVQWQGSPGKKDIVSHSIYDGLGREAQKYQPYASQSGSNGSFRTDPLGEQGSFYGTGSWDANIARTPHPYSVTVFERSPLGRVLEQGFPGAVWQPYGSGIPGSGHTARMAYGLNAAGEVPLWTVGGSGASTGGAYAAGTLYRTVTKDENWTSGKAGTVAEFRDKQDRVVLKRQWSSNSDSLSTHYVYDRYGNLCYVVPPAVTGTSFSEGDAVFKNFIYGYHYDGRRRVIEKKVPGKGWEHMVYNRLDQLVFSSDSVQRASALWSWYKYDALGRQVITGIQSLAEARQWLQDRCDVAAYLWEERTTGISADGYSYRTDPLGSLGNPVLQFNTISYYDDYSFPGYGSAYAPTVTVGTNTKGLATGTRTLVLGTSTLLLTVIYYDGEGRVVETVSDNHLGGIDRTVNTYSFSGQLLSSTRVHTANSNTTTIANSFTYDHMGRKVSTKANINGQGEVVLNKMEYNELGQLKRKDLHSTNGGGSFYQGTKFSYNERGWLKGSTSPEFRMKLGYDTLSSPQYNGNISAQLWGSGYGNRFDYAYDRLNRLTNGTTSSGVAMGEVLTYDAMGNIATLARDGAAMGTYSYTGNQLTSISGGLLGGNAYSYDPNGNMEIDGLSNATYGYNHLNLPKVVVRGGASPIQLLYTYDATGRKLKKVNNVTATTTDYVDGIQYTNGTIDFIRTEEGRAVNNSGTYRYEYNLTDHLGNVRYSFDIYAGAVRELQRDDYYAFGLRKAATAGTNNYLYNGKELQDELGQYDYGARFYDPVIGRFNTIDPLSEKSRRFSPYGYAMNNPIRFIDVDGMYAAPPDDYYTRGGQYLGSDNASTNNLRMISSESYNEITAKNGTGNSASTTELQANSRRISYMNANTQTAYANGVYKEGNAQGNGTGTEFTTYMVLDSENATLSFQRGPSTGNTNSTASVETKNFTGAIDDLRPSDSWLPGSGGTKVVIGILHPHPEPGPGLSLVSGVSTVTNANGGNDLQTARDVNATVVAVDKNNIHMVDPRGNVSNNLPRSTEILRTSLERRANKP